MRKELLVLMVWTLALTALFHYHPVHAQNALISPTVFLVPSTVTAANCPPPVAGTAVWCFYGTAGTVSFNGAAPIVFAPPSAAVAGVTSWNGLTGAVTYTPPAAPVSSVAINGVTKTGAASFTLTTPSTVTAQ